MAFKLNKGKTKFVYLPVTTSTALTADTLVTFSSGLLIAAVGNSTASADIIGVVRHTIASTDSDYATARSIEVEVPVERYTEWLADYTTTLVAADIGIEIDLTDSGHPNRGGTTQKICRTTKVLSATKGICWLKFQGSY